MPRVKSIADLRRELAAKERTLLALQARRQKAMKRVEKIDKLIEALGGELEEAAAPVASRGARRGGGGRRKAGESLVGFMERILAKKPDGMRAKDIAVAVKKAGYATASRDFYSIVATTLATTPRFERLARGVYKLGEKK